MQPAHPSDAPSARRRGVVERHGAAAMFYGLLAVTALLRLRPGLELAHFERRIISEATLDAYDVGARVRLYGLCLAALVLVGGAALALLRLLERRVPSTLLAVVNASSAAGLACLYFALFRAEVDVALGLVLAVHGLALAAAVPGSAATWLGGATYVGWLATSGAALALPVALLLGPTLGPSELALPGLTLALGLGLHAALSLAVRREGEQRGRTHASRWVHASLPLCALALVPFLRDELFLLTRGRGLSAPPPWALHGLLVLALAAWGVWRWRRSGRAHALLDPPRTLGLGGLPLLLLGALSLRFYQPFPGPPPDLLEPANAGLSIHQWFRFGRLPFVETFDVHGLWDSAWGFAYAALSGYRHELWSVYDFGMLALPVLLLYLFLRRATGSPWLALFAAALVPYADELAPVYCAPALAAAFVLERAARRRTFGAYLALFLAVGALAVWRLDIGFGSAVGVGTALLLAQLAAREPVLRWVRALAAGLVALALFAGGWVLLCSAAGVDPLARARDVLRIVDSSQAYGHTRIAPVVNELVRVHLFAVPALLVALVVSLLARWRRRQRGAPAVPARRDLFLPLGLLFLAGYSLANVPRGLVRHSFLEPGNVYLVSFSVLALGLYPWWRLGARRPLAGFAGLVALTSVLALHFPTKSPLTGSPPVARALWDALPARLESRERDSVADGPAERDALPDDIAAETCGELKAFLDANLAPEETFLDLANAPLLYVYTDRVSPHWLNHLMCAPGEPAQRRVLDELAAFEVPVVVLRQDPELARAAGLRWWGDQLDGVPFRMRQFALFEHVYERYEPFALLDRWHVWLRRGYALDAPPGEDARTLLRHAPDDEPTDSGTGTTLHLSGFAADDEETRHPRVDLEPGQAVFLRVEGRAREPLALELELTLRTPAGTERETRTVQLPAGAVDRRCLLVVPASLRALEELRVRCEPPGALELAALSVEARRDPAYALLARRGREVEESALGLLPRVWARHDERRDERRVVTTLLASPAATGPAVEERLAIDPVEQEPWSRGIHLDLPAVRLAAGASVEALETGDTLVLAGAGPRRVREVVGRQVLLEGGPLDPLADGCPHALTWRRPGLRGRLVGPDAPLELELPAARAGRPLPYLVLSAADRSGRARELVVEYGSGEAAAGRFILELPPGREAREHCVRASAHASWWRRPAGWLRIRSSGGPAELLDVALADGP